LFAERPNPLTLGNEARCASIPNHSSAPGHSLDTSRRGAMRITAVEMGAEHHPVPKRKLQMP